MSERRPWPNSALWARDDAAESLVEVVRALEPVVAGARPMTETEMVRRTSRALAAAEKALRLLAQVGAPVREI